MFRTSRQTINSPTPHAEADDRIARPCDPKLEQPRFTFESGLFNVTLCSSMTCVFREEPTPPPTLALTELEPDEQNPPAQPEEKLQNFQWIRVLGYLQNLRRKPLGLGP